MGHESEESCRCITIRAWTEANKSWRKHIDSDRSGFSFYRKTMANKFKDFVFLPTFYLYVPKMKFFYWIFCFLCLPAKVDLKWEITIKHRKLKVNWAFVRVKKIDFAFHNIFFFSFSYKESKFIWGKLTSRASQMLIEDWNEKIEEEECPMNDSIMQLNKQKYLKKWTYHNQQDLFFRVSKSLFQFQKGWISSLERASRKFDDTKRLLGN